jgi:DNA-binding ferritin-like protein
MKCRVTGRMFNKKLQEACEAWDELTEKLNELGLYANEDYRNLEGRIVGDELMLRVGSAPGHATHIDLRESKLHYYDNDVDVNEAMKDYLEKYAGLSCNAHESGVDCEGVNEDNVIKATKVLSFATSKDLRFRDPDEYYLSNATLLDFLEKQGIEIPIPTEQIQEVRKALKEYIDAVEEALKYAPTKFKPKLEELAKDIEDVLAEVEKKVKELEAST